MFQLNKISQIATVGVGGMVSHYEEKLLAEGYTSGYLPCGGPLMKLDQCLAARIPNLYFLKYGGIDELCVGGEIMTMQGRQFTIKTAPRAATGCDLRKTIIGAGHHLGKFTEVCLKIFPLPESWQWGLAFVETEEQAYDFARSLMAFLIHPLMMTLVKNDEVLAGKFNLQDHAPFFVAFKLTGLGRLVMAEKAALDEICGEKNIFVYWTRQKEEAEYLDQKIITDTEFLNFENFFGTLIGYKKNIDAVKREQEFQDFFGETPI